MKRFFTLVFTFFTFASVAFAQCPDRANVNANMNRLFLDFDGPDGVAEALAYYNAAGPTYLMTVDPGGSGTLFQTSADTRVRIDITTLPAGPYTGTITSPSGLVCTYIAGVLQTTLPISLTSFTAKKMEHSIRLEWETEREINNDRFIVERSTDSRNFEQLAEVSGEGNSTGKVAYSFEDKNPKSAINYYRLRQIDYSGSESLSEIITMNFLDTREDLKIYPTTVKDEINFDVTSFEDENLTIEILDASGHALISKAIINNEIHTFNLSNLNLSGGMYYVRCRSANRIAVGSFLVAK